MSKTIDHPAARPVAQPVTPELRRWIVAQAQAGCRPEDVLAAMKASGWHEDVAIAALEAVLSQHVQATMMGEQVVAASAQHTERAQPALASFAKPGPEPLPLLAGNEIQVVDRKVQVLLSLRRPRVVLFGGFLSDEECDQLVSLANKRLTRSETVEVSTGGSEVNAARTSEGMFFGRGENELCQRIERRIAALLNWPVEHGEGLQVLRYRPGAEYKAHHDYFDPAQPGSSTILARGGQRIGTLVMYLNTPERGGATTFPDAGLEVAPIKGHAVFFAYPYPDPAMLTLHSGAPVLAGEKWVATKWLREGVFN